MDPQSVHQPRHGSNDTDHHFSSPALSTSEAGTSMAPPAFQMKASPIQASKDTATKAKPQRDRETESEESKSTAPVQRVVDAEVPLNSRIRIDRESASDFGDTGTIVRLSRNRQNCMAVRFDNEPDVLYRVYFHEMSVIEAEVESEPESEEEGPGVLKGGAMTVRMHLPTFMGLWDPQQKDQNIREDSVAWHIQLFTGGGDQDPPFFDGCDFTPQGFVIRTSDGRHRLTAAHRMGKTYVYVFQPSASFLQQAEIAGVKGNLFPDL